VIQGRLVHCHLHVQVSVTPMDSTVTAVTVHFDPVYQRVATHFPHTSANVGIVNGQRLNSKQSTVKPRKISVVNSQMPKRAGHSPDLHSCGHSCDYGVYGSDTPLMYIREYPDIPIQYSHIIKRSSLTRATSQLGTGSIFVPATLLPFLDHTEWKKLNEFHFLPGMLLQSKHTSSLRAYFLFVEILVHLLNINSTRLQASNEHDKGRVF